MDINSSREPGTRAAGIQARIRPPQDERRSSKHPVEGVLRSRGRYSARESKQDGLSDGGPDHPAQVIALRVTNIDGDLRGSSIGCNDIDQRPVIGGTNSYPSGAGLPVTRRTDAKFHLKQPMGNDGAPTAATIGIDHTVRGCSGRSRSRNQIAPVT